MAAMTDLAISSWCAMSGGSQARGVRGFGSNAVKFELIAGEGEGYWLEQRLRQHRKGEFETDKAQQW